MTVQFIFILNCFCCVRVRVRVCVSAWMMHFYSTHSMEDWNRNFIPLLHHPWWMDILVQEVQLSPHLSGSSLHTMVASNIRMQSLTLLALWPSRSIIKWKINKSASDKISNIIQSLSSLELCAIVLQGYERTPSGGGRRGRWCASPLTVATMRFTAAADSSSPLGCSTMVTPRYFSWNTMPSSRVSLVSVQFSGSSVERRGEERRGEEREREWVKVTLMPW